MVFFLFIVMTQMSSTNERCDMILVVLPVSLFLHQQTTQLGDYVMIAPTIVGT